MTRWKFKAAALPYSYTALDPILSEKTLKFHHDKHYVGYVNKLQELLSHSEQEYDSLLDIINNSQGAIFNNAAQILNHELYFEQLAEHPQSSPEGVLLMAIERDFGSLERLKKEMNQIGISLFGSGWVWLVKDSDEKLSVEGTSNALTPITEGKSVLLVIDLWEHAYYLDYQNNRVNYLNKFWSAVDWNAIQKRWAGIPVSQEAALA